MERILITDGDQRSALACVRSLGRAGHQCYVLGPGNGGLAARSRYCQGAATCADPSSDPVGFWNTLGRQMEVWGITVLFPMTERSLRVVLPRKDELAGVLVPFPEARVFEAVSNKAQVLERASEIGIPLPQQWVWETGEGAEVSLIPEECFPLAVKPTRSVSDGDIPKPNRGVEYLSSREELDRWKQGLEPEDYPLLLQERILGTGAGVFLLLWKGELKGVMGHRRIREKPPSGGVSVVRDSTEVDSNLLERSLLLLQRLGFDSGVAMVEFKVQRDTGIPFLMEINGRFWGSLQLAIDAGVDFPNLLLRAARQNDSGPVVSGIAGARTRWLMGDVDQLLAQMFKRRSRLHLPPGHPGRLGSFLRFIGDCRPGVKLEVLQFADPKPFFWEVKQWLRDLV